MARLTQIDPNAAQGKAKELLDAVQNKMGAAPNITRVMANEPAVLDAYLGMSGALSKGNLLAKAREAISLAVASYNGCDYCASAHSFVSKGLNVDDAEILKNLGGSSQDPKTQSILSFAYRILENKGRVTDSDLAEIKAAGLDDGEITEVIANVALNVFTNYLNNVAHTDIDFPVINTGLRGAA